jgi:hypothetical protein
LYCARPDFSLIFPCTLPVGDEPLISRCPVVNYYVALHSFTKKRSFAYFTRVSEFDDAILSRIYLLLRHDNLNSDARRDIWSNFPKRAHTHMGAVNISHKHSESLVKPQLNGRQVSYSTCLQELIADYFQIKNAVVALHALATKQGAPLSHSHPGDTCKSACLPV